MGDELSGPKPRNTSLACNPSLKVGSSVTLTYFGNKHEGIVGTLESYSGKYVFWEDDVEASLFSGGISGYTEISKEEKSVVLTFTCNVDFEEYTAWLIEYMWFE